MFLLGDPEFYKCDEISHLYLAQFSRSNAGQTDRTDDRHGDLNRRLSRCKCASKNVAKTCTNVQNLQRLHRMFCKKMGEGILIVFSFARVKSVIRFDWLQQ